MGRCRGTEREDMGMESKARIHHYLMVLLWLLLSAVVVREISVQKIKSIACL